MLFNHLKGALLGAAIGDALGVPGEFQSRSYFDKKPITDYKSGGVHNQEKGTWSDDTSMICCTIESIAKKGYDIEHIGKLFTQWLKYAHWTARHEVFDIGNTTKNSIIRILRGESPLYSGEYDIRSNGNGSLMRIFPVITQVYNLPIENRFLVVKELSSVTHAHFRSFLSCFIYVEYFRELLLHTDKKTAYANMQQTVLSFIAEKEFNPAEVQLFDRILQEDITQYGIDEIQSSGYVIHTLEASLWCFLRAENYAEAVLKAINLGDDTDTTGAVTGALAGFYYIDTIPENWMNELARTEDLQKLADKWIKSIK